MKEFTEQVRAKGWSMKLLADRWGVSPRQMSNIASNPQQIHLDALNGLPEIYDYQVGDTIFVTDGPFLNFQGVITRIYKDQYFVDVEIFSKIVNVSFLDNQISYTLDHLKTKDK